MTEPTYVLCGLGRRATTTYLPLPGCTLLGAVDPDPERRAAVSGLDVSADLDDALARHRPDWLVVTSPDHLHAAQIRAGLAAGASVLVEKPMTRTAAEAAKVRAAPGRVLVAHNLRFLNLHLVLKDLLTSGRIGRLLGVSFAYHLTAGHGRSYLERWHRRMEWSGGLQITKSCHHFDLLSWWLADEPESVFAHTARHHFLAEVPSSADADIDDTITALIRYRRGAAVTYSLTTCSSWEGYELRIHGDAGALATTFLAKPVGDGGPLPDHVIKVRPHDGAEEVVRVPREPGRHGGADLRMTTAFAAGAEGFADTRDGALAVAVGEAVTRSSASGVPVPVRELFPHREEES